MYKSSYYFDIDRMIHILLHRLNSYNFKSLNELHNLTISLTKVSGNNALTAFPFSVTFLYVSHASFLLLVLLFNCNCILRILIYVLVVLKLI